MYEVTDQFDVVVFTGSKEDCIAYLEREGFSFDEEFEDGVSQFSKVAPSDTLSVQVIRYLNVQDDQE